MMNKVIFILVDALGLDAATKHCGFLEHMGEAGQGAKYRMIGELPSISRPMYETLLSGLPVWKHGITSNDTRRRSRVENMFSLTRRAGLVNACAGYDWLLELYGEIELPFRLYRDRFYLDGCGDIMHGIFYCTDDYPDAHLYADGEYLRRQYAPDFLMIHPMGVDDQGHKHGALSKEYAAQVGHTCDQIAVLWENWQEDGYQLVVTGDHGMDPLGLHEGNEPIQREVPLYILSPAVKPGDYSGDTPVTTLSVAPLLCALMGMNPGPDMKPADTIGIRFR